MERSVERARNVCCGCLLQSDRSLQHKMPQLWTELLKDVSVIQSCQSISDLTALNTCLSPADFWAYFNILQWQTSIQISLCCVWSQGLSLKGFSLNENLFCCFFDRGDFAYAVMPKGNMSHGSHRWMVSIEAKIERIRCILWPVSALLLYYFPSKMRPL